MAAEVTPKKPPDWKNLTDTVQDAESLRQESINAHHDHLITEIETSDGPLGTSLRCEACVAQPQVSILICHHQLIKPSYFVAHVTRDRGVFIACNAVPLLRRNCKLAK